MIIGCVSACPLVRLARKLNESWASVWSFRKFHLYISVFTTNFKARTRSECTGGTAGGRWRMFEICLIELRTSLANRQRALTHNLFVKDNLKGTHDIYHLPPLSFGSDNPQLLHPSGVPKNI